MKNNRILALVACCVLGATLWGCANLQVENTNNPDTRRVLATPNDLRGVMSGAFVSLYTAWGPSYNCNVHMEWTGDYITMTNNFRAFWSQFKIEPRPQYNNTLGFADRDITSGPFRQWYSAISSANDIIRAIEKEGKQVGVNGVDNPLLLAAAYFCKGLCYGYLANTFDKAYIVDVDTDISRQQPFVDYKALLVESLKNFDRAIDLASRNTFTFPGNFINTPVALNSDRLARLARTYAANFIAQNARTRAENAQSNWDKVLEYTATGMRDDYIINLDYANWNNSIQSIASLDWYWRTDHRIIRLMDPNYPKRFPAQTTVASIPRAQSTDARLDLYFKYETSLSFFRADRGPQLRSHYRFIRYEQLNSGQTPGPSTFLYAYTNDLLRAEAFAMKNQLPQALMVLNAGKRVTVGKLAPLPDNANQATILETVFAERDIELTLSDFGIHFKDMRRRDALQRGTLVHFPMPVDELAIFAITPYSFGGEANATTAGTADGSNAWYVRP
jgi:hypothetical protein